MVKGMGRLAHKSQQVLWLALIMMISFASRAGDDDPQVYTGRLGTLPIVVELDLSQPDEVSGRYFYQKYRIDLPLSGSLSDDTLSMKEGMDSLDDTLQPVISLERTDTGWEGRWTPPQGASLPLTLSLATVTAAPNDEAFLTALASNDPYEYLRLKGLTLEKAKQQEFMGYQLQWWREPRSKIALFEIVTGYTPAQRAALNLQLRARLWQEVIDYHSCMLGASRFGQGEFAQEVTPEFFSPTVISVNIFTHYDCGGAHPDFGSAPLNLNVKTGQRLALEDVLWIGQDEPFHYTYEDEDVDDADNHNTVSFDEYSDYRAKQFAPWLVNEFRTLYPAAMQPPKGEDDDCNYSDHNIWNFPAWYFTPKGIYFGPSFARALRACEGPDWSILPYNLIHQHPGGVVLDLPQ